MKKHWWRAEKREEKTYGVIGIFPISEARKSLDDFDAFPRLCKSTDSEFVGELLALLELFRLEELASSHDKSGEKEGAFGADVRDCVESGIEKINERVQT